MAFDNASAEVRFALDTVRKCALLAQRISSGMALMGLTKSDFSPVTVADFAGQAVAAKALLEAYPDDVLVAEESSGILREEEGAKTLEVVTDFVGRIEPDTSPEDVCAWIDRGNGETATRFWTLDPIDGTKGYLRGGQFAVAFSLIEGGEVKLGVLGCPNLGPECTLDAAGGGVLVAAERGKGTWCTALQEEGDFTQLRVSENRDASQARLLRSFVPEHTNFGKIDEVARYLGIEADPVSLDSQAKYALLGSGGGDLLFRFLSEAKPDYKECIWDQAAGSIVVEEAGGRITDLAGNSLDFTQGRTLAKNRGICASNGLLHGAALEAVAKLD